MEGVRGQVRMMTVDCCRRVVKAVRPGVGVVGEVGFLRAERRTLIPRARAIVATLLPEWGGVCQFSLVSRAVR